jgi:hypothetical protein
MLHHAILGMEARRQTMKCKCEHLAHGCPVQALFIVRLNILVSIQK